MTFRVHEGKHIHRRDGVGELRQYQDARDILEEDFHFLCGYCGKDGNVLHQKFHIDHFVPVSLDKTRENDYYNLVLACPKCNLSKSNKWPTKDIKKPHDDEVGFVDPATEEYDKHMQRTDDGYVVGITPVGKSMCRMLHLDIRRTDLYWKISQIRKILKSLEILHAEGKLKEIEKDFYIEMNMILNHYIDESFEKGE